MAHEWKNYLAKWQTDSILRKRRWIASRTSWNNANKEGQEVTDGMEPINVRIMYARYYTSALKISLIAV